VARHRLPGVALAPAAVPCRSDRTDAVVVTRATATMVLQADTVVVTRATATATARFTGQVIEWNP
jgi:hypothetical protein